ncbi:MAG: MarR family transcriptional regulator [Bacteroidales bacterium]|nr:MarR family transcriptional regulator [Bacteroidales bacterium]
MKEKENIFGLLLFVAQRWTVNGDALLTQKAGITTKQWMLLVILIKNFNDKQPTISETAKVFGTSRQNLKQVAESLQKKAFIDIKPDANDFRIQRISLTGKHEHFFLGEENEQWQKDFINSLFEGFTEEELKMFNGFMDRLSLNF